MPVTAPNHFTILTDDVPGTIAFYEALLGLAPGPRPPFPFPGAWLYAKGQPILHVIGGAQRNALRAGVIDHMAFTATGLDATLSLLRRRGIEHELRPLPGIGTLQLFFQDPNGAKVELDFDPAERATP